MKLALLGRRGSVVSAGVVEFGAEMAVGTGVV